MSRFFPFGFAAITAVFACLIVEQASAQDETEIKDSVFIELNAVKTNAEACTFTFQVINGHAQDLTQAIYEAVLFDQDGQVNRLTLFDFGALPSGRPRVRQFVLQGARCQDLSRVLINGAHECAGAGLAEDACISGLKLSTRTDIEVAG